MLKWNELAGSDRAAYLVHEETGEVVAVVVPHFHDDMWDMIRRPGSTESMRTFVSREDAKRAAEEWARR